MQKDGSFSDKATENGTLCPNCRIPGGYLVRIPRGVWRRLFFLKQKHYLCRECGHKFYTADSG